DSERVIRPQPRTADRTCVGWHGSGISFKYFLMLAGSDEFVKADRMLCRFMADAIGTASEVTPGVAQKNGDRGSCRIEKTFQILRPDCWTTKSGNFSINPINGVTGARATTGRGFVHHARAGSYNNPFPA